MIYNDPDHRQREACTCGPLVYVRTLKCASTFFWNSFIQFGWEEIAFDKIDWQTQRVFSHIMDPDIRRIKGVTEFLWMNQTQDLVIKSMGYQRFIRETPMLDIHTMSYYENLEDRCDQIDWIPLTNSDHQTVADLTSLLLFDHGIKIFDNWAWQHIHTSNAVKKSIVRQVSELLDHKHIPRINEYLEKDRELYQRVVDRFNPNGKSWADVSWLR